jgi:hypothetical protein
VNRHSIYTYKIVRKGSSLILAIAYLLVLFAGPLHEIEHQAEEQEVCYDDNACHLRLVHQDTENGCDHESHVSGEKIHCEFCALRHLNSYTDYTQWTFNTPIFDFFKEFTPTSLAKPHSFEATILVRGPPHNS